ncbi:MAG: M20/M25/M40 family metallo-hydrolase [Acidimicrobiia bacterium]|nr:M20/M25/M40 family metallo-hydrolase [Acidimicrobiia bacterium]NNF65413.1 M20/M25/M40 family metallo-hydrolase [Acidimicrobiia bacterium]
MTAPRDAIAAARTHRETHGPEILAEFADLLARPNVSRNVDDVHAVGEHITAMLAARGIDAKTVSLDGAGPVVVGTYPVEGAKTTIGIYAHYDGQPVDQPDWVVEPFKPTLADKRLDEGGVEIPMPLHGAVIDPEWRLYARSASDDKAPIVAICAALDAMQAANMAPTSNIVFLFEGEEEIGSVHLPDYLRELEEELAADVWFICDGPVHQTRRPQIVFGVRGITEMEITAYGPVRPLHSGHYGNWAPNPNMELARLLASMKDDAGNVVINEFYDGTQPITAADEAAVAALPDDDEALRTELGLGATEADGAALALRLLMPSLNVRGFDGGAVGKAAANVIPTHSTASLDIRLAPGNDPEVMMNRVESHIRSRGWHVVDEEPTLEVRRSHSRVVQVTRKASYPGVRMPMDSPLAVSVLAAAALAANEPVVAVPTFGGSVPLHYFTTILGTPIALTPFANHDNNQHAANENIRIANLWYGIDLMAALMTMDVPVATAPPQAT